MGKLRELILELCPNGVKYRRLEEVCDFVVGFSFKAKHFNKGNDLICRTSDIQDGKIVPYKMIKTDISIYSENLSKYIIKENNIVIGMSGSIKVGINETKQNFYLNQRVGLFHPYKEMNNKFLYYVLCNEVNSISNEIEFGSVKNLSNEMILDFKVPTPSKYRKKL